MNKVLYHLSVLDCDIMDGWHLTPSTCLAKICKMPRKDVLKELRRLKEQGLVSSSCEGYFNEYREHWCVLRGWHTTPKAHATEEYKAAYAREREICKECFNIDIGELESKTTALGMDERDNENG